MKVYTLYREQFVPAETSLVWNFFSNPNNLSIITPAEMNIEVLTLNLPEKIYSGLIINYNVSPLRGIRLNWMTEIKNVKEGEFFTDEQRKGPFLFWHHKHIFMPLGKGILMKDEVTYSLPFSFLGKIVHHLVVKKKLEKIFDFRSRKVLEIFSMNIKSAS